MAPARLTSRGAVVAAARFDHARHASRSRPSHGSPGPVQITGWPVTMAPARDLRASAHQGRLARQLTGLPAMLTVPGPWQESPGRFLLIPERERERRVPIIGSIRIGDVTRRPGMAPGGHRDDVARVAAAAKPRRRSGRASDRHVGQGAWRVRRVRSHVARDRRPVVEPRSSAGVSRRVAAGRAGSCARGGRDRARP